MTESPQQPQSHPRAFAQHVIHMPRWHKTLLTLAVALMLVGAAGQIITAIHSKPEPVVLEKENNSSGKAHLVGSVETPPPKTQEPDPTLPQRISPWMTHVGLSFFVAFVLGWLFRAFLKVMSLIGLAVLAVMCALSYFHVFNIDFSAAKQEYASSMAWATDQAQHLGRAILGHLPGSTSSLIGFFIGFRRR